MEEDREKQGETDREKEGKKCFFFSQKKLIVQNGNKYWSCKRRKQ